MHKCNCRASLSIVPLISILSLSGSIPISGDGTVAIGKEEQQSCTKHEFIVDVNARVFMGIKSRFIYGPGEDTNVSSPLGSK